MKYIYDDGGRAEAGFKGKTGDCCCRAIAIATGMPYKDAYDLINEYGIAQLISLGVKPKDITGAIKELEDALHVKSAEDLREQEARIDKLRKEAEGTQTDKEITVTIASDLEEYSQ